MEWSCVDQDEDVVEAKRVSGNEVHFINKDLGVDLNGQNQNTETMRLEGCFELRTQTMNNDC